MADNDLRKLAEAPEYEVLVPGIERAYPDPGPDGLDTKGLIIQAVTGDRFRFIMSERGKPNIEMDFSVHELKHIFGSIRP